MTKIRYRKADVDGLKVFYREAGRPDAPTLLLLHGFPTAGHMFRELIPMLADRSVEEVGALVAILERDGLVTYDGTAVALAE